MDTVAVPSYTTIYLDKFVSTCIYPEIRNDCLFYARYIDEIFIIYAGKTEQFSKSLNRVHDYVKFDHEKSKYSITFWTS